ncbi:MAG: putative glycoside hydrolase, partial [Acidimicrobiia bacterium]
VISIAGEEMMTGADGMFSMTVSAGTISVTRPAWHSVDVEWVGEPNITITLEPRIVRAVRVSKYVAGDPEAFARLLDLADTTIVNTLVFDTKDESGSVLYESNVAAAREYGAIRPMYDPLELLAAAKEHGLYTITRVVSFEDDIWVRQNPAAKLLGSWVDMRDVANWEYPLALAVEACELGFDEIQFDYVRFPAGKTGAAFNAREETDQATRVGTIQSFLAEARSRLHPLGCALSADVFGIVVSAPDDQGIGQRPEELSQVVDAVSPMVYPSHYSDGWLGFPDPNDFPAEVTAGALDDGTPRLTKPSLMRPWLQGFWWTNAQIKASIEEAEKRGVGWMIWNAPGNYSSSAFPDGT